MGWIIEEGDERSQFLLFKRDAGEREDVFPYHVRSSRGQNIAFIQSLNELLL